MIHRILLATHTWTCASNVFKHQLTYETAAGKTVLENGEASSLKNECLSNTNYLQQVEEKEFLTP